MVDFRTIVLMSCYLLPSLPAQFFVPGQGHMCSQPFLICSFGCNTVLDAKGCKTCSCPASAGNVGGSALSGNPGGDPFHQGGALLGSSNQNFIPPPNYSKPCYQGTCDLKCENGYYMGPAGCQFCICAPQQTTTQGVYVNPCPGEAASCNLKCPNGYRTARDGCFYCSCKIITEGTTTPSVPMSADECIEKITECQLQHPYGFMTDDTCQLCVGKDEIYHFAQIPEDRQPSIRLENPCIQGFYICKIFCASGYRTGPKSCQYCACNNS